MGGEGVSGGEQGLEGEEAALARVLGGRGGAVQGQGRGAGPWGNGVVQGQGLEGQCSIGPQFVHLWLPQLLGHFRRSSTQSGCGACGNKEEPQKVNKNTDSRKGKLHGWEIS